MKKIISLFLLCVVFTSCAVKNKVDEAKITQAKVETIEKKVSFLVVGDNLIHGTVYKNAQNYAGGTGYDFKPIYKHVAEDIKNADLAYINQETPLGGEELGLASYPQFNSPKEVARDLAELGFDIVSHANNHIVDRYEKGIKNTISAWREHKDVTMLGVYENEEDRNNIRVVEKNGIKFAFLAYTYGTNGISLPKNSQYIVPYIEDNKIKEEVTKAKELADFVIPIMHWGNENQFTPSAEQERLAKMLADLGCDAILGSHPHVIQPIKWIDDTLVIYSLGNFISSQNVAMNMLGGMVSLEFSLSPKKIENVKYIPTITHYTGYYKDSIIYPMAMYNNELASKHGILGFDKTFSYDYMSKIIESTIDASFR